jgi:hypothetical protein
MWIEAVPESVIVDLQATLRMIVARPSLSLVSFQHVYGCGQVVVVFLERLGPAASPFCSLWQDEITETFREQYYCAGAPDES